MAGVEGQRIGPYRLVRLLGRGGFADVWLAERSGPGGFNRQVALKLVVTADGDADGAAMRRESLLREARLVSWLDAPSIVSVEAADSDDDLVWMAMEYCDGGPLSALLRRLSRHGLPMPPAVAVRIARDVARALAVAHRLVGPNDEELCIVHRDLKPGNVLLTMSGEAKVCDFGIAKATDETNITGTGMLKGTVSYVAPELWNDVRAFSPASDAFALGTLLVEMLTLERLHGGGSMPLIYRRIVEGTGTEDAERVGAVCPPAVPLVADLLKRDRRERPSDLASVAVRLDALLATLPGPSSADLLLRVLDYVEGRADRPGPLPDQVGQAWAAVLKKALGADVPLVPGPAGAERAWALAVGTPSGEVPVPDADDALELSLDGTGTSFPVERTLPWKGAPPAAEPPRPTPAVSPLESLQRLPKPDDPTVPLRPPPGLHPPDPTPARPQRVVENTLNGSEPSPGGSRRARKRKADQRRVWILVGIALLLLVGLLAQLAVLVSQDRRAGEVAPVVVADVPPAPEPIVEPVAEVAPPPVEPASTPVPAAPTPRVQAPAAKAPAAEAPAAEAPAAQAPVPTPQPRPAAVVEVEPVATPKPRATPQPIVVLAPPCVLVTSRPGGAYLWVDGRRRTDRVRSKPAQLPAVVEGRMRIGMSMAEASPQAELEVRVRAGSPVQVHCDLLASPTCREVPAEASLCPQ